MCSPSSRYNDVRNGVGTAFRIAPMRGDYDGEWVDDTMVGEGIFLYENGDKYTGPLRAAMLADRSAGL